MMVLVVRHPEVGISGYKSDEQPNPVCGVLGDLQREKARGSD